MPSSHFILVSALLALAIGTAVFLLSESAVIGGLIGGSIFASIIFFDAANKVNKKK